MTLALSLYFGGAFLTLLLHIGDIIDFPSTKVAIGTIILWPIIASIYVYKAVRAALLDAVE